VRRTVQFYFINPLPAGRLLGEDISAVWVSASTGSTHEAGLVVCDPTEEFAVDLRDAAMLGVV
jgi:hypothetical protein